MYKRRKTRTVNIGAVKTGSGNPVSIQSMTTTDTRDVELTVSQIKKLASDGCEIVRVAVRDMSSARAVSLIKKAIDIPLVADIHYDHKLAIESVRQGADKIRINPGNIKKRDEVLMVIDECRKGNIPIRIGVNSGSIAYDAAADDLADVMVENALRYLEIFKNESFTDIVISLKTSSVPETIEAYRKMAEECDYPFHLGVTAAGSKETGSIKNAVGIGSLLVDGIGDTLRVSLTGDPQEEVSAAKRILSAAGVRFFGPEVISCPTCGRCQVDLMSISGRVERALDKLSFKKDIPEQRFTVAVMGCEVNGPGEAESADVGIAFGKGKGALFCRGEIVKTVPENSAVEELLDLISENFKEALEDKQ